MLCRLFNKKIRSFNLFNTPGGRWLFVSIYLSAACDAIPRSKLAMARSSVASVLILLAGLLALVAGMPQTRPGAPSHGPSGQQSESARPTGPGGRGSSGARNGPGSRAFRCPGCDDSFGSEYAVRQHRIRYSFLDESRPTGTAPSLCAMPVDSDVRAPIVSRWTSTGQRAGGSVNNSGAGAVNATLRSLFEPDSEMSDSDASREPARDTHISRPPDSDSDVSDSPSRMRSPMSNYQPSPPPASAAPGPSSSPSQAPLPSSMWCQVSDRRRPPAPAPARPRARPAPPHDPSGPARARARPRTHPHQ